jgi:two-component system response regulator YesN
MIYSILLVDDEMPALRFMQAIIDKYLPEFTVLEKLTTGAQALAYLKQHPVDLMITDISMPGMDGITLARQARAILKDMHIVIVSGYAEFDYARGALNVAADDYLLKPLSVPNAVKALKEVAEKLTAEYAARRNEIICNLACSRQPSIPKSLLSHPHCFALIRWGNLHSGQPARLFTTHVIPASDYPFTVLQGVDEDEKIVVSEQTLADFHDSFLAFAARTNTMPYTAVLSRMPMMLASLHSFIEKASNRIDKCLIIGKQQLIFLEDSGPVLPPFKNPSMLLHKIEHFTAIGNMKMVKDTLVNMAAEWEKQQYAQQQITPVVYSLMQQAILSMPKLIDKQDQILRDTAELLQYAPSCGSLVAGLYDILYDDNDFHDKNLSPKELCESIMTYIRQNFAKPLSVQSVCTEIGVSQTYMSRLLRTYGSTSFSAFLTQCRMDAAMELITKHLDILLRDVAACVGYDDPSYFSKVFHQAANKTPTQFAAEADRNMTDIREE